MRFLSFHACWQRYATQVPQRGRSGALSPVHICQQASTTVAHAIRALRPEGTPQHTAVLDTMAQTGKQVMVVVSTRPADEQLICLWTPLRIILHPAR